MRLADTSAWVEMLRDTGSKVDLRLRHALAQEHVATTEPVVMEVLAGARDGAHDRKLRSALSFVTLIAVGGLDTWERAATISRVCRDGGVTIASRLDCLIAAVAIRENVPILHADRDFDRIAECVPLGIA